MLEFQHFLLGARNWKPWRGGPRSVCLRCTHSVGIWGRLFRFSASGERRGRRGAGTRATGAGMDDGPQCFCQPTLGRPLPPRYGP